MRGKNGVYPYYAEHAGAQQRDGRGQQGLPHAAQQPDEYFHNSAEEIGGAYNAQTGYANLYNGRVGRIYSA